MTATTSSDASETDSARNRVSPSRSVHALMTSAPPPPSPPGRCTSSSTTGGFSSRTRRIASSTVSASPTTRTPASSDAFTPVRNMWWSSTSTTSTASLMLRSLFVRRPDRHHQVHLGPALRAAGHLRRAAAATHPPDDRLAHPEPVGAHLVEVEPVAMVPHEHLDLRRADLQVQRHGRAAVHDRVDQRLARGLQQRLGVGVGHAVTDHDRLDGDRVARRAGPGVLDLGDDPPQRRRDGGAGRGAVVVEPLAQLALLGARHAGDLRGVVGPRPDEGEGLQDRVVQVGRDVGALGLPRAGGPLVAELAHQPQPPRASGRGRPRRA